MTAEEFLKNIDKNIDNGVFLIYGSQDYLKDTCVKSILKNIGADELCVTHLEGSCKASDVINPLQSISFFSPCSAVIADVFPDTDEGEKILSFIQKMPSESKLIFSLAAEPDKRKSFYKKLVKHALIIDASLEKALIPWIGKEVKRNGFTLTTSQSELIVTLAGEDMYVLKGELNKLGFLKKQITDDDIMENVSKSAEYNIFLLNSFMLKKQYDEAFRLAGELIKNDKKAAISIISLLSNRFYQMYMARCCLDKKMSTNEAVNMLVTNAKMNKYAARYIVDDAKMLTKLKLKEGILLLAEYDAALKTGGPDEGIEPFLIRLYT